MYSLLLCILLILAVAQACRFMLGWESTLQFFEQIAHFFVSKRAICSWKRANCSHRSFKRATEQRVTEGIRSRPLFKMSSFEWKNEERKSKEQKSEEQKSKRAKEQQSKRSKERKSERAKEQKIKSAKEQKCAKERNSKRAKELNSERVKERKSKRAKEQKSKRVKEWRAKERIPNPGFMLLPGYGFNCLGLSGTSSSSSGGSPPLENMKRKWNVMSGQLSIISILNHCVRSANSLR